jgi:hypothetical protein
MDYGARSKNIWQPGSLRDFRPSPQWRTKSFNLNAFSINAVGANPTVNAPAIVANLKLVALPGFDEMNILKAVHLA